MARVPMVFFMGGRWGVRNAARGPDAGDVEREK
jgi:hypothetical protein